MLATEKKAVDDLPPDVRVLNVSEVCEATGLSERTVRTLLASGELPPCRMLRRVGPLSARSQFNNGGRC